MTPEQIIEMATQAGFYIGEYRASSKPSGLHDLAQLVRNAALEEAAQLCEFNHHTVRPSPDSFECAAGIRGLKS